MLRLVGRREHVVLGVVRDLAAVLPEKVAGDRVDGLDDVARVRHVQHAVVGERRPLLRARLQRARPDHAQVADVLARDRVQRAVAPSVERPAPHHPVRRIGVLQHRIGDRDEALALRPVRRLGRDDERRARHQRRAGPKCRRPDCTHEASSGHGARQCRNHMHVSPAEPAFVLVGLHRTWWRDRVQDPCGQPDFEASNSAVTPTSLAATVDSPSR